MRPARLPWELTSLITGWRRVVTRAALTPDRRRALGRGPGRWSPLSTSAWCARLAALATAIAASGCVRSGFEDWPCSAVDCSGHGRCVVTPALEPRCNCDPGFVLERELTCVPAALDAAFGSDIGGHPNHTSTGEGSPDISTTFEAGIADAALDSAPIDVAAHDADGGQWLDATAAGDVGAADQSSATDAPRLDAADADSGVTTASDRWSGYTPDARYGHSAVWTGSRMILWGGVGYASYLNDGASYDPEARVWTPVSTSGAPSARGWHAAIWTGSHMVIWGGMDGSGRLADGGRYDPATDSWSPISSEGAPTPRAGSLLLWTGSRLVVWGGYDGARLASGGLYDPASDSWTTITQEQAPNARQGPCAVWTGTQMILWGGDDLSGTPHDRAPYAISF